MPIVDDLLQIIRQSAAAIPAVNEQLSSGADREDDATGNFVRSVVAERWPEQVEINQPVLVGAQLDFYIPSEATAIGVPIDKMDIYLAAHGRRKGLPLERLILIGKTDAPDTRNTANLNRLREWALAKHNITVEIHEISAAASEAILKPGSNHHAPHSRN